MKMKKSIEVKTQTVGRNRRNFLKVSGLAIAGSGLLLASCSDDDDNGNMLGDDVFDLGTGNLAVLNYAYALEQLEAAFYAKVVAGGYYQGASATVQQLLTDVYNHEVIHREFFRTAISSAVSADMVLPDLEIDFGADSQFDSEDFVINTAIALEDTGVAAYNGAGKLITVDDAAGQIYLGLAGKIVSVEARHASAFRDLKNPGSMDFAGNDILIGLAGTAPAFDKATPPADILAAVSSLGFIKTNFTAKAFV